MSDRHGMTDERWEYLMQPFEGDENVMLTAKEVDNGWHWCYSWDSLLIHVEDVEFEHCKCDFMKKFRKEKIDMTMTNDNAPIADASTLVARLEEHSDFAHKVVRDLLREASERIQFLTKERDFYETRMTFLAKDAERKSECPST